MRLIFTTFALICSVMAFAQVKNPAAKTEEDQNVFTKVENEAHTDWKAWRKHMGEQTSKVVWTDSLIKAMPKDGYVVEVQFVVDKYGRVTDVAAKKDPGGNFAKVAISAIRSYKGSWTPANQCGRSVKAYKQEKMVFLYVQ